MRARYVNYFLNHVLSLQDDYATYYVQYPNSVDIPAPVIALKALRGRRQTVSWLLECVGPYNCGIHNMRSFLNDWGSYNFPLYEMDDNQIIDETAKVIMECGYPIVVMPVFEPPGLHSDFADHIFEAKNGTLRHQPEIKKLFEAKKSASKDTLKAEQQSKGFQFKSLMRAHYPEVPLDGDPISNALNFPSALSASIANDVMAFTNAVLAEAQAMQDKGGLEYLKDAKNIQWQANVDWFRRLEEIGRKGPNQLLGYLSGDFGSDVEELVRTGPNRMIGYVTSNDMWSDLGQSLSAENWINAFKLGIYSATLGRLGFKGKSSGVKSGGGTRTTNSANAAQRRQSSEELGHVEIKTVKKDAFELEPKKGSKTTPAPDELGPVEIKTVKKDAFELEPKKVPKTTVGQLKGPAKRHTLTKVNQKTVAKNMNTVIEPNVDVAGDVAAINKGLAKKVGDKFVVNGRTYGMHDGTLYPISGKGFHQLDRPAFKGLGVLNKFGNSPKANQIMNNMGLGDEAKNAALKAWRAGQ